MKKDELLKCLQEALKKGELKDPSIIAKVECADERVFENWNGDMTKMWGGAHTWRYSNPDPKSPEQVASEAKATEQAQKEISEIPEHMHDHYKGMRRGGLYMGSKGMGHQAAKDVLNIVMHNPKNLHTAAAILMDRGHNASQARKVLGDIAASHKKQVGE